MNPFHFRGSYLRNLPHLQPRGATLFITYRLAGSLPRSLIRQFRKERAWLLHLAETNPVHFDFVRADFERLWFAKFERVLDGGAVGPTWLRDDRVAALVAQSLRDRDGKLYRLHAFSIMPNHVHTVLTPMRLAQTKESETLEVQYHSLASIMQGLKGCAAFEANQVLSRKGEFWAHESYDHWIRDAEEWKRIVAYVLHNPVKARYVKHWQDWKWSYRRN